MHKNARESLLSKTVFVHIALVAHVTRPFDTRILFLNEQIVDCFDSVFKVPVAHAKNNIKLA